MISMAPPAALADAAPNASAEQEEAARQRFARGVKLYDDGDFKLALIEFTRAYEMVPDYRFLYNIGHVHLQLGNYAKALRSLTRYLQEGGNAIAAERRAVVEREIASTRQRTATLTVRVSVPGAQIEIDQDMLGFSPSPPQVVDGGEHRIRVTKPGFLPQEQTVVLATGDVNDLYVALAPLQEPTHTLERPGRPEVWLSWTATAALTAAAGVCGGLALSDSAKLSNLKNTAGTSQSDRQALASQGNTFAIATDVLGGAAIAAAGLSLFLTLRHSGPSALRAEVGLGTVQFAGDF